VDRARRPGRQRVLRADATVTRSHRGPGVAAPVIVGHSGDGTRTAASPTVMPRFAGRFCRRFRDSGSESLGARTRRDTAPLARSPTAPVTGAVSMAITINGDDTEILIAKRPADTAKRQLRRRQAADASWGSVFRQQLEPLSSAQVARRDYLKVPVVKGSDLMQVNGPRACGAYWHARAARATMTGWLVMTARPRRPTGGPSCSFWTGAGPRGRSDGYPLSPPSLPRPPPGPGTGPLDAGSGPWRSGQALPASG
jgi:hypothetical protein